MKKVPFYICVAAGILITIVTIYGYTLCRQRAGLPREMRAYAKKGLLIRINDIEIQTDQDIEFVFCRKRAGEWATFFVQTDEGIEKKQGMLIPHYLLPYPEIYLTIGSSLIVMAFIVFFLRPQETRARIFFWASLAVSCSLVVSGGFYCLTQDWISYIPGILFYAFYSLIPAFVLHFSLTFLWPKRKFYSYLIYLPAAINIIVQEYLFLKSSSTMSIDVYRQYQSFSILFRGFFIVYFILSFIVLFLGYRKAELMETKAQIKWILYGLFFGVGPMLFMYQLPRILFKRPLISEELVPVFVIFITLSFAVSIYRFKLMNIELIINRSLVYSILTVFTVGFYLLFVQVIQRLFASLFAIRQTTVSVIGAFAVAVAFNPARKKIQEFVDRTFFRISYDYQKSILSFNERAHKIARLDHLTDFFLAKVDKTIPLVRSGIRVFSIGADKGKVLIERGQSEDFPRIESPMLNANRIFAIRKGVMTELGMDFSCERSLEKGNWEMVIPLPFRTTALAGFVVLGKKKAGTRFSGDDIELLLTMAETFALNCERIHLQEEVIYERAEKEKFDELNKMKTEFIASVSHEIRTPMSSIQGMSEILQQGKIKVKKKQEEIVDLMANECSRLSRFLHNILDYGKIEQNEKTYRFVKTDITQIIQDINGIFAHRFRSQEFSVRTQGTGHPVWLDLDPDSIKQALTNLIDNAIKYASDKRVIDIVLDEKSSVVEIQVRDQGIGIPAEELCKIFEGFYRTPDAQKRDPNGVGLGLKIVKHIMEAHGGEIRVESLVGKGSTFSLIFPR